MVRNALCPRWVGLLDSTSRAPQRVPKIIRAAVA